MMQSLKSNFVLLILGCCTLFMHSSSYAQSDSSDIKLLEMSLEEILNFKVTTVLKSPGKYTSAPATIHVITNEQIRNRGYTNLEEVLDDIPEIEIQKKASPEYVNYFTLRGIHGSEKFIIMMDGMRINSPTGTPLSIVNNYPVANAKQIEIILGPASALYGVDAFSGIINIITFKGDELDEINISSSYGMYNTVDNSFVSGVSFNDVSFSIAGKYYSSDEPYFPDLYKNEFAWYEDNYSKDGKVLLPNNDTINTTIYKYKTPTNSYAIHAKLNIGDFEAGYFRNYESHGSSFSIKPEYSIYAEDALFGEWVESMYISHNHKVKNNKWQFSTVLSHSKDEVDPKSNYINSFTSYNRGYKYAFNKALKFEEQVSWFIKKNTTMIAGLSFQDISSLPKSGDLPFAFDRNVAANVQNIYYIGTNIVDSAGNDLSIMQDFYYLQYQNIGTYLQLHSDIKEKLSVTLGIRYDHNNRYDYSINPRIGLVYSPIDKLKFKLLYGQAYFAPSPYSAYQHYGSFIPVSDSATGKVTGLSAAFWRLPSEKLNSQEVSTYEFGGSWFINNDIALFVNGFYNDLANLVGVEGYTGQEFHGVPVSYIQRPVNVSSSSSYGGTIRFNFKSNLGIVKLNTYGAYTYIDGEFDGNKLPFTANHTVKGGMDLNIKRFNISPRVIFRGESFHRSIKDANGNFESSAPFTIINLAARYIFISTDKINSTTFVKVSNLFNTKYYNLPTGGNESFANVPQDMIRISVGLNFRIL